MSSGFISVTPKFPIFKELAVNGVLTENKPKKEYKDERKVV